MEALRSALQPLRPLTQNLPAPIRDLGVSLLGPSCYETLVLGLDPTDAACLRLAVSKALGLGIVGASSVVKVPQIAKLARSRSAAGVSFLAYLLETASYLVSLAYNARSGFPFSTYGETALILGQNAVIAVLVLNYSGRAGAAAVFVAALAASAAALFSDAVVDMRALGYLQAGAGVLGVASKVPQIVAIFREGGTGQLSAFTVFNYLAGSLSRIFTTLQEVDDKLILYGFVAGFTLNCILAAQMVYYWNAPSAKALGKRKEVPATAATTTATTTSATSSGSSTAAAAATTTTTPSKGKGRGKGPTTRRRG